MNFQIVPDVSGFAGLERWRLWLRERGSPAKEAPKTPEFLSWREAKISFGQCQSMKNTQFLRGSHELQGVTTVSRNQCFIYLQYLQFNIVSQAKVGCWKLEFLYTLHLWKLFANPLLSCWPPTCLNYAAYCMSSWQLTQWRSRNIKKNGKVTFKYL
jgi:hypothetical protein